MKRREACVSCYKRKQKCNKQKPCLRCHELGIDCYYEIEKEKEKQKQKVEENDKGKSTSLTRYRKDFTKSRLVDKYSKLLGLFKKVYGINQDIREDVLFGFLTKQMNHSFLYQQKSFLTLVNLNSNQLLKELEPKLIETFFTFNNKIQLLISPEKKSHILVSNNEHDIALKYAICCYTYQTYRYLSNLSPVKLNQIPFYIKAKTLINSLIQKPSIQLLQCSLLLSQQEYGFDCKYKALMSSMFATKLYQILGLNSKLETKDIKSEELAEKYRISLFCINQDLLASFPSAKPSIIPFKKDTLSEDKYGFNINENLIEPYKITVLEAQTKLTKTFNYLVGIDYDIKWNNIRLKNREIDEKEYEMTLDQFDKETNLLGTFVFLSFKMKEILDTRIDLIQHPFLLTYVSIFYFYRSVLLQIKIYQVKLHQTRNIKDLFYYTEYSNEAKKIAKETYINNELLEKKLKVNLKDKFNDIFYILHFGHIINLEYLTLPFSSEACSVSNHFSCKIIEKIQGLAKYWPIYTNFMAKAKGCNSGSGVLKK